MSHKILVKVEFECNNCKKTKSEERKLFFTVSDEIKIDETAPAGWQHTTENKYFTTTHRHLCEECRG